MQEEVYRHWQREGKNIMKRIMTNKILLNIIVFICLLSMFTACGQKKENLQITEGELFTLEQAYNNGFLSHDDLLSIAYYHQGSIMNAETATDVFTPKNMEPKELSKDIDYSVRQTLVSILNEKFNANSFQIDNIVICAYYGTYHDGVVIRMIYSEADTIALTDVIREDVVSGIKFYYSSYTEFFRTDDFIFSNSIMYWKRK